MTSHLRQIDAACVLTRDGEYLRAYTTFLEIYGTENQPPLTTPKAANGLSFFGLTLALVTRKYKEAVELCKRAIDLEFYNGDHYANLSRVYTAAGKRKQALETAESGLKILPDHEELLLVRRELGVRSRPPVPFLDRAHPINVTLGQSRHAKKVAEEVKKKPVRAGKRAPARPAVRPGNKKR